jgi:hypothetical protein
VSRDIAEFDCEAILFLALPRAVPAEDGKVEAKANEHGLQLIYILLFGENPVHRLDTSLP